MYNYILATFMLNKYILLLYALLYQTEKNKEQSITMWSG